MSAIKNGIKELHCKESLSGKRFKRSIAHNNLKLTCNIYHIQVFKLPFLQIGLYKITSTDSGDEFSSLFKQCSIKDAQSPALPDLKLFCFSSFSLSLVMCILQRSANGEARRSTYVGRGRWELGGGGGWGEVRVGLGCP